MSTNRDGNRRTGVCYPLRPQPTRARVSPAELDHRPMEPSLPRGGFQLGSRPYSGVAVMDRRAAWGSGVRPDSHRLETKWRDSEGGGHENEQQMVGDARGPSGPGR